VSRLQLKSVAIGEWSELPFAATALDETKLDRILNTKYRSLAYHSMPLIKKVDLIGAQMVAIHYTLEITDDGLDTCQFYFTVDQGFTFSMPFVGEPWETVLIPREAKPYDGGVFSPTRRIVNQIRKQRIAGVYCRPVDPDSVVVFLDNDAQISVNYVAPHGTGGAGLYFYSPDKASTPKSQMVDFFDVPLTRT